MVASDKPLLLLDVDGVFAPFGMGTKPVGYSQHVLNTQFLGDHNVWLNTEHGDWLRPLQDTFDFIWCTDWEDEAPMLLAPLMDLKPAPVIHFLQRTIIDLPLNKLPNVIDFAATKPLVWIDDNLGKREQDWAESRGVPTLLIAPDANIGLVPSHIGQLEAFAHELQATDAHTSTP